MLSHAQERTEYKDSLSVHFEIGCSNIDTSWRNNSSVTDSVLFMVHRYWRNPGFRMQVVGYASPDGTDRFNQWLSVQRMRELVKWYLAAIDQLTDIYIGEWALNEASRLYPRDEANRPGGTPPYWHYTSSSADGSDPWVLWAEEGASRGTYFTDNNDDTDDSKSLNGDRYSYRCLRNLGVDDDSDYTIDDIQDIIFIDPGSPDASGNYTFNLSRMNPKSLRTSTDAPLEAHDETSVWNLPYEKLSVHFETRPEPNFNRGGLGHWDEGSFTNATNWSNVPNGDINCPEGYRIPNMRELLIMSTRLPESAWPTFKIEREGILRPEITSKAMYFSKTGFSMQGNSPYSDERKGFIYDAQSNKIFLQNNDGERGYLRCVRDID